MVDKSEKFRWLVRLGFAVRGLVYVMIGYLALFSARSDNGPEGALSQLRHVPLGKPLLYVAALGLAGYALFRLSSLVLDIEHHGNRGKGLAQRVGHGASGLAHLSLAWIALQLAQGGSPAVDGSGAREASGTVLSLPFGWIALGAVGLGFLAGAAVQAEKAATAGFMKRIASNAPKYVEPLGRAGYGARSVVFLVVGWSLMQSAWFTSSERIKNIGDAVSALAAHETLYTLVAAGLLLFGLFGLSLARWAIVPDIDSTNLPA